jgi:hypothetical protein
MIQFINVKDNGVVGDAKIAADCSILAGDMFQLVSASPRFVACDKDKVIVVYDVGQTDGVSFQPLSTTIAKYVDPYTVQLANKATYAKASSRVVYGTDDTAAIQAALDKLATAASTARAANPHGPQGGILFFPPAHYLLNYLALYPTEDYNHIRVQGCGQGVSTLENWKVDLPGDHFPGVINIGDYQINAYRLHDVTIADLTIRQVLNADARLHAIYDARSHTVRILGCEIIGGAYEGVVMGGDDRSFDWVVSGCLAHGCGLEWNHSGRLSALNLNGSDWIAEGNIVRNSGQCMELGSKRGKVRNNRFYATLGDTTAFGLNLDSAYSGIAGNEVTDNLFVGFVAPVTVACPTCSVSTTTIRGNRFIDCGRIQIASGLEDNSMPGLSPEDKIHGTSFVDNNFFIRTQPQIGNAQAPLFHIGDDTLWQQAARINQTPAHPEQGGLERIEIRDNISVFVNQTPTQIMEFIEVEGAYGGGGSWQGGTPYTVETPGVTPASIVLPSQPTRDDFYYRCVVAGTSVNEPIWPTLPGQQVSDGGATWERAHKRPKMHLKNNIIFGQVGTVSGGNDIIVADEWSAQVLPNWSQANVVASYTLVRAGYGIYAPPPTIPPF